jgi:TolB-like protein/Tfp pilus assembly protein PilF
MSDPPIAQGFTDPHSQKERPLESWGEIATYLRRDIRTVQRWEKDLGLPVRRLMIGKLGQVYAFPSELDKWVLERQPKPPIENLEPQPKPQPEPEVQSSTLDEEQGGGKELKEKDENRLSPQLREFGKWLGVVVGLALLASILIFAVRHYFSPSPEKTFMFVRPFANHGGDPIDDGFVAGLTDEIITQIGKLDPSSLGVFAPTTSKELSSKSIQEIRKQLNAKYVLEGSVRRVNDQLRIDVALVTTSDQTPIWTNFYTGSVQDVLLLQDKVAADVARETSITLPKSNATARAAAGHSVDPRVYDAYLAGRLYWLDRDMARSLAKYKEALDIDPKYAPARAGLAMSYLLLGESPNDALRPEVAIPQAREAAQEAIQIDPKNADAYCVLANIALSYDHNLPEAEHLFKRAIEVDPNNVTAHQWYGSYLMVTNQMLAAEKEMNHALEIDPASPLISSVSAELKYYQRDYEAAIQRANQTLEEHPGYMYAELWLAWAYREKKLYPQAIEILDRARQQSNNNPALLAQFGHALAISGNKDGARRALAELQSMAQHQYVPSLYFAGIYVGLGEKDEAFKWLEKAYQERHDRLVYLGVDPMADPLRSDARFHELMKKVGLP